MNAWPLRALSTLCELNPKHSRDLDDVECSFVPMEDLDAKYGELRASRSVRLAEVRTGYTHFRDGDVLFAKITPCMENGKSAVARNLKNGVGAGSTEFFVLRTRGEVLPDYLHAFLRQESTRKRARAAMTGVVGQARVPRQFLESLKMPVPPRETQVELVEQLKRRGTVLGAADARLQRSCELIPQFRRSLLASAFCGDLTSDWRSRHPNVEPLVSTMRRVEPPRQNRKADDPTPGDGLYAICVGKPKRAPPPGWQWVRLLDVAKMESGHTPRRSKAEYWDGDVPWIGIRDARAGHGEVLMETAQTVTELGLANSASRLLPAGTVCLSRTASVGYVTVMGRPMATSQDFVNWVCTEAILPKFLMYLLMAEGEHIRTFGKGSTHTTIYFPEAMAFHVCLPSVSEQREVVRKLDLALAQVAQVDAQLERALEQTAALEQATLAAAFRGEL